MSLKGVAQWMRGRKDTFQSLATIFVIALIISLHIYARSVIEIPVRDSNLVASVKTQMPECIYTDTVLAESN